MIANLSEKQFVYLGKFLESPRIGILATVNQDGSPQTSPIWYRYSGGKVTISTTKETLKYRNLLRNNRASLCVFSAPEGIEYASLSGWTTISDDKSIWEDTRAIVDIYERPVEAEKRMRRLRTQERILITLYPDRILFNSSEGRRSSKISEAPSLGAD